MTFWVFGGGCGNVLSWQVSSILSMYSMFERTLRQMNEYNFVTQDHVKQLSWTSRLLCRQNKELGWTAFCVEHQTRELGTLGDYQIR